MPKDLSCATAHGFTMPAEWEEQRAILLSWPLNPATWEDRRAALEKTYAGFAAAISHFEDVKVNCMRAEQPRILRLLSEAGANAARVELLNVPTNDAWTRCSADTRRKPSRLRQESSLDSGPHRGSH